MSHCRPQHAALTAVLLLLYASSPASAIPWNKLQSSHFVIVGEVAPGRLTAIAKTLEDFRQAADRVFGDLAVESPRPLTIVVVNPVTMLDYAPGGSNNVAAFYRGTADRDYIVMGSNTFGGSDFAVVLHEYQHLICPDVRGSVALPFERAVALEGLGERAEAIRGFDSVGRAPTEALADIRGREWRHLEAGQYTAAARLAEIQMKRADSPDASAYLSLVRTVSVCLQGACAEARNALKTWSAPAGVSPWVQQLLRYHTDGIDEAGLLKGATTKEQETEAHTYVALDLLARQKTADAVSHFKWVAERGSRNVSEYYVAVAHLARLNKP